VEQAWKYVVWGAGAVASCLFGGLSGAVTALLVLMVADYISGVAASAVEAMRGEGPGLSSKVGLIGLIKKALYILTVAVMYRLDIALANVIDLSAFGVVDSASPLRDGFALFFVVNELLSMMENLGRAGVPFPEWFENVIEALRRGKKEAA